MAVSALARKLGIRPGSRILILNPPNGYKSMIEPLPRDTQMMLGGAGPFDMVQAFVGSRAEVETRGIAAIRAAAPGGTVWLCYPKKSSGVKSDLSRRSGWDAISAAGWRAATVVSIDETWAGIRCVASVRIGDVTHA